MGHDGWVANSRLPVNVVEVREVAASAGRRTAALAAADLAAVPELGRKYGEWCGVYTMRWCVEEYHKALKSGTGAEDSQMERAYRIESLVAVLGIVAVRLLNTKWLARTRPDEPVDANVFGPELLALLAAQFGQPHGAGPIAPRWCRWRRWAGFWPGAATACPAGRPSGVAGIA